MIRTFQPSDSIPWEILLLADEKEKIQSYLNQSVMYVYEENHHIWGVVLVKPIEDNHVELVNVAVAQEVQGKGIGKELVSYALTQIKKNSPLVPIKVTVKTGDISFSAIKLYQKCGFDIVETVKDYFVEHYKEPLFENGMHLKNQVVMQQEL